MTRKPFSIVVACLMTFFVMTYVAHAQEYITGPWLWMIAPTTINEGGSRTINVDSLAAASDGVVTEACVAANGANVGDRVGNYEWTLSTIRNIGIVNTGCCQGGEIDNVTDVFQRIGWTDDNVDYHSSYALITLESTAPQNHVLMKVGSDDAIKVWLNGAVVHTNPVNRGSGGFQDEFWVNLKQGDNLLFVKISEGWGNWSMFVGVDANVNAIYKSGTANCEVQRVDRQDMSVGNQKLYYTTNNKIQRANLDGSNIETLVTTGLRYPHGIALDVAGGKMYWTDFGTRSIQRANLDGSNIETLVTTGLERPRGIALDVTEDKMYWTDSGTGRIQRANLDGSNIETLVTELSLPDGIALDVSVRKMYWRTWGPGLIQRANLDGTNVEPLTKAKDPQAIALDVASGKMYWTDGFGGIKRNNLDGTQAETLITDLNFLTDIDLDIAGNKMYWIGGEGGLIQRANLDGSNIEDIVNTGTFYSGIALGISPQLLDNRTPQTLEIVSGVDQQGSINTALANPFVVKVRDGSGSAFAGVAVTFAITAGGGSLSIESATTDADGRAESTLTLGPDVGTNTVSVSVSGIQQTITFTATSTPLETAAMIITGAITNTDGSPAEAGLLVTATIGSTTQTAVSAAGGNYRVIFINFAGVVASSLDTVEVQVLREVTSESAEKTVQLSSKQIIAQKATIDLQFLPPTAAEYLLSVPSGISLIHVPLKVTAVDGVAQPITSIADLYNALGGAGAVNFFITYDSQVQEWRSYLGPSDTGTPADRALTDDMGIIAGMTTPASIRLSGSPLGINGNSTITLNQGLNLVGLPLQDSRINRVSDLFALEGIGGNVPVIILTDNGEFKAVGRARDPGDIPIIGGQSFIMTAQREATVTISGDGWYNFSAMAAAPPVGNADLHSIITGIQVTDTTPVLALRGSIADEGTDTNRAGFRITVKNLSTGREVTPTVIDETGYRLTIVDIETGRAAQIGDILEVSAQSSDPFIGVEPLRYTITAEDVRQNLIQLPTLTVYEIPTEAELLSNYPNPFNPETWIPYRLAEDAFVTLTIYDLSGRLVRTLEVGHRIASVYENRSKAIYWDGRNGVGEQVASGVYFYNLSTGNYSATRKMLVVK